MLAEERYRRILGAIMSQGNVSVMELCTLLDASESTVRRDLNTLARQGRLVKVHGGATAIEKSFTVRELGMVARNELNRDEKRRIAKYASSLVKAGDNVYIDTGTTVEAMAEFLRDVDANYVTNSFRACQLLHDYGRHITLLGGMLTDTADGEALVGPETMQALSKYNFTKGFFGTDGISRRAGITVVSNNEAAVKSLAIAHCYHPFILADRSKFGRISTVTYAQLSHRTIITTSAKGTPYEDFPNIIEVDHL